MEVKKCIRCGSFYATNGNTCELCAAKDKADIQILNNYFEENESVSSINALALNTNIAEKNITRLIENNQLSNVNIIKNEKNGMNNISINL